MPQKIRMWEITAENKLKEITSSEISLESRLEDWLADVISVLDPNLIVIGRQVRTDFDGEIDLLCLDREGSLVVVELKKGRTPREVTAQALDYASWVKDLSYQQIAVLAQRYLNRSLDEEFSEKFGEELPDTLNESHRSLIVAEEMDASTERIVRYLSEMKVPINVATVQHFKANDGREMLAQVFLIEPEVIKANTQSPSKRRSQSLSTSEIQSLAQENNVGELYFHIRTGASGSTLSPFPIGRNLGFRALTGSGSYTSVLIVHLDDSNSDMGLRFRLNGRQLSDHFDLSEGEIRNCLPTGTENMSANEWRGAQAVANWIGFKGYFRTMEEIDRFWTALKK